MANKSNGQVLTTASQGQADNGSLVQILNDEKARLLTPAVVYISLVMVLGLFGNAFVCYYYTFKEKRSPNTFFIVILSVYDLLTCLITMPYEIAIISLYYTFVDTLACNIFRFVNSFLTIASMLTLVAIATDRYKRICQVTRPQMNIPHALRVSIIIMLLSTIMAIPTLLLHRVNPVPIAYNVTLEVYGHRCTMTKDMTHRVYVKAYTASRYLFCVLVLAVLVVLYSIIGRTIYHHRKRLSRLFKKKGRTFEYSVTKSVPSSFTNTPCTIEDGETQMEEIISNAPVNQLIGSGNVEQCEPNIPSQGNPISSQRLRHALLL